VWEERGKDWEGSACGGVSMESIGERRRLVMCDAARSLDVTGQDLSCCIDSETMSLPFGRATRSGRSSYRSYMSPGSKRVLTVRTYSLEYARQLVPRQAVAITAQL